MGWYSRPERFIKTCVLVFLALELHLLIVRHLSIYYNRLTTCIIKPCLNAFFNKSKLANYKIARLTTKLIIAYMKILSFALVLNKSIYLDIWLPSHVFSKQQK